MKNLEKLTDTKINIEAFLVINVLLIALAAYPSYNSQIFWFKPIIFITFISFIYRYFKKRFYWHAYIFAVIGLLTFVFLSK
jgi:hypothetical protein